MRTCFRPFFLTLALLVLSLSGLSLLPFGPFASQPVAAEELAPAAAPDLVVESVTLRPPNPTPGSTGEIVVRVKNQGDAATAGAFRVYLYVDPADVPPNQSTPDTSFTTYGISLPASGVFTWTRTNHTFATATPKIYVWVDPPWENRVAEANENNNLFPQPPVAGDAYEKDDTCPEAKPITTDGVEQARNLLRNPGADQDWVKFTAQGGVTYIIEAKAIGADADLVIALLSSCSEPPFGGGDRLEFTAPVDGTYFVKVEHKEDNYGPDNAYSLKITNNSACASHFETNDSCPTSGYLTVGQEQAHTFCKAQDLDWTQFEVKAGVKYKVAASNLGAKTQVRLGLFASCQDANSAPGGESLEFTAATTGLYYVRTENVDPNVYGADVAYSLRVDRIGGDGCVEDALEQDDNLGQAKVLTENMPQTHNVCPAGEEDWGQFSASAGVTYTLETVNLGQVSDPVLCLYTANAEQLLCNDDGGAGTGARLVWQPPAAGTYYVSVKDANPAVAGVDTHYDLRLMQGTPCTPDAHEPDNTQATARSIPLDSKQAHTICPAADEDWATFSATANTAYLFETTDAGPEADTVIELYDATGKLLAQNDDHAPGGASQLAYTIAQAGVYGIKVRLYNPNNFGTGTEYQLRVRAGTATPTPTTPPPTATPTPTATPQPAQTQTLFLVNRTRLVELHGEGEVALLLDKLTTLAALPTVQGKIVRLDNNAAVSTAYADWNAALTNVDKANAVTVAIRNVLLTYLQQESSIQYLVLVGDDRALPFRRVYDNTDQFPEKTYRYSDPTHPTGAAQRANYFLSDDYYVDQQPTSSNGRDLYLPDLAIGRLIETPTDMIKVIDAFSQNPTIEIGPNAHVLLSGYDFVQDVAADHCQNWTTDLGNPAWVNCSLIGNTWKAADLRALQTRTNPPFKIQSISGHAAHWGEGAPDNQSIYGHEIASSPVDLSSGLLYTPGCHAGLNLPPSNSNNPVDLAQAFASKGSNYIGHTGYGWGSYQGLGWSEKLLQLYTRNLLSGGQSSMGQALTKAKITYVQLQPQLDAYDEKILQSMIFYGLPMFQARTGLNLTLDDPFPDVRFTPTLPRAALGPESDLLTGTVQINFKQALAMNEVFRLNSTAQGNYYDLAGYTHNVAGQPVQPLHFGDVSVPNQVARAALVRSATFITKTDFTPLIAAPYNEYLPAVPTNPLAAADRQVWYPANLSSVQSHNDQALLVTQIGQYHAQSRLLRVYDSMTLDLYYSSSSDQTAPTVNLVDGLYRDGMVSVKVDALDASGIATVVVAYFSNGMASTQLQSLNLTYDAGAHKWRGLFPGQANARFFVQVLDQAGNLSTATNKAQYYTPASTNQSLSPGCIDASGRCIHLPIIRRS